MMIVINLILVIALSSCEDSGIDLLPGGKLSDLQYADDIVLLSQDPGCKLQAFLNSLSTSVAMFGMRLAPSKCKMLLQDWFGPAPNLTLTGEDSESLKKSASQQAAELKSANTRLHRAAEETERLKAELDKVRSSAREGTDSLKHTIEKLTTDNRRLERQKAELLSAFKKQMRLIDVLRRQKYTVPQFGTGFVGSSHKDVRRMDH
ncbi:unnamed protein product [Echinostoma caproni]|uniref:Reverse transcriptase domain-containing protein n=1 Tax=Echinostoma caproni TaxID=27848 RepID=A0A183B8A8_9TREM|nr:unnamed protein product [Echinostoma caproni]